ncbi:DUF1836 domain-containing protein [Eubacterium sp. 1001713B170207_170306_E7]|uniref:DUF1836 domain-containing protein n=1 Tax=Eubacterium sp. 1001713B170207_170306_E7 TaxID=2787097 RepID=UPI00189B0BAC|nr:DUF1836 domain-containing protein [Eubacterium sp. 1001713B170207_170306_E7]
MTDEQIFDLIDSLQLDSQVPIKDIPDLDLYMDQLITLFEKYLAPTKRRPDDKLLTKTMINNYTKNKLLSPAQKKKYTVDHVLLMLLIYQLKQVTSMEDIKTLFSFLKDGEAINHEKLQFVYQKFLDSQAGQLSALKDETRRIAENAKEKTAGSGMEPTDSILMCLLLFQQSLHYKRLAEKLLDEMTSDEA